MLKYAREETYATYARLVASHLSFSISLDGLRSRSYGADMTEHAKSNATKDEVLHLRSENEALRRECSNLRIQVGTRSWEERLSKQDETVSPGLATMNYRKGRKDAFAHVRSMLGASSAYVDFKPAIALVDAIIAKENP